MAKKKAQVGAPAQEPKKVARETTVRRGDIYEAWVASYIQQIYNGASRVTIHRKKKYPQRISDSKPLEIDVSIEEKVFVDRDAEYDKLTIVECKDHNSPIKREVIDHLIVRRSDLNANDAICFSTSGFQSGAIETAKHAGVKLVVLPKDSLQAHWLNRRNTPISSSARIGSILRGLGLSPFRIYPPRVPDIVYSEVELLALLDSLHSIEGLPPVPYISSEEIKCRALAVLPRDYIERHIDIELILSLISQQGYSVLKDADLNKENVLGVCDFQEKEVRIYPQENRGRLAFTLVHELGHILLHEKFFKDNQLQALEDTNESCEVGSSDPLFHSQFLEMQANKFASYFLMPDDLMWSLWAAFKQEQRIAKAHLYIDSQPVNQELYKAFVRKANTVTVVSAEALRYRLKELNILKSFQLCRWIQ